MKDHLSKGASRVAILVFVVSVIGSTAVAQNAPGDVPGLGAMSFVSVQSVALGDGEMVYAGSFGAGVFKSSDAGKTWQPANDGLTDPFVYVVAVTPDRTVFAGTLRGGIFRSHNQGKNWVPVNVGLERLETRVLVPHQGTLYAGTGSGVYRSSNGGETWVADNEGLKNLLIRALAIDPDGTMYVGTTGMGIYRKRTGPSKWVRITATQLSHPRDRLPENFVRALVTDGRGGLYAGTADNGVYVSGDHGDSWRAQGTGMENASIRALTITGNSWFAGTGQGMYRSVDRGKTWVPINAGLSERSIQSFAVGKDGLAYAGTSSGIFKTEDHGGHWSPVNLGLGTTPRILGPQH